MAVLDLSRCEVQRDFQVDCEQVLGPVVESTALDVAKHDVLRPLVEPERAVLDVAACLQCDQLRALIHPLFDLSSFRAKLVLYAEEEILGVLHRVV